MSTVPECPPGAHDADPPSSREEEEGPTKPSWEPSLADRWGLLNLEDPNPSGGMPIRARVPDALAYALVPPGAVDPIEGIVDGVRIELDAMAYALRGGQGRLADFLTQQVRRLETAMQILRWTDNRQRMPMEEDFDEPPGAESAPPDGAPRPPASTETPEDVEQVSAAGACSDTPKP